jgi:membrane protease YdiL (CAAX protease family)
MVAIFVARSFDLMGDTPEQVCAAMFSPFAVVSQVLFTSSVLASLAIFAPRQFGVSSSYWLGLNHVRPAIHAVVVIGVISLGFIVDEVTFLLSFGAPDIFNTAALDQIARIFEAASPPAFVTLTIAVMIGPGIGEELFFRGLVLRAFRANWSASTAILGSSFLFGLMHFDPLHSTGAGLLGLYFGFVALRTGSVWPGVTAHAVNNLLTSVFARCQLGYLGETWKQGHPLWLLLTAAVLLIASLIQIITMTSKHAAEPAV